MKKFVVVLLVGVVLFGLLVAYNAQHNVEVSIGGTVIELGE